MLLNSTNYALTEHGSYELFYPRAEMQQGESIEGYLKNVDLYNALQDCEEVVLSFYWKPIGDSFLALVLGEAVYRYVTMIRPDNMPTFIINNSFETLIQHLPFASKAVFVENSVAYFKEKHAQGEKIALITDDDPFEIEPTKPVHNSEEFKHPRFYELNTDGSLKVNYASRPSRYFLTLERQLGTVLPGNPNNALPFFIMNHNPILRDKVISEFGFDPDDEKERILIISQTSMVEKKFGCTRFLDVAEAILPLMNNPQILFMANSKEESPEEWLGVLNRKLKLGETMKFIDSRDFELLAYIFARCRLAVGNDTGFSHLASMSRISSELPPIPVIIIYSRHDYRKWTTGHENVIPITTSLAEYLADNDMSVAENNINAPLDWGIKEYAYSIPIEIVINTIKERILK